MPNSINIPYSPGQVPTGVDGLPRFLADEFRRIQEALVAQPVALSVDETGDYTVGTVANWVRAFVGATPGWDVPGGNFDSTTGIWTCPQSGLYSITSELEVSPYGLGNKNYYAGIRIYRDSGGVITYRETTDGGVDNVPLGVTLAGLIPLLQGDQLAIEMTIVHETFVGTAPYDIGWQVLAVST